MGGMKDTLGDTPYPYSPGHVSGSDTSLAAARSIGIPAGSIRETVFRAIADAGPAGITSDRLEETLGRHQTISARVRELVLLGRVKDSGRRGTTRSGRSARLYIAASNSGATA